jgi:serine/threonine protein kinase
LKEGSTGIPVVPQIRQTCTFGPFSLMGAKPNMGEKPSRADVTVPTMSKNRYEVIGNLGCGATSRVDKARDTILGRTVALKTLVHSFGAATEQKQFLREAQIVSQLSHPSIINLYDVGIEEGNVAYLVMEYVTGKTLQQVLLESPIPFPRACAWAADLAGALARAHRAGIIHGDVKPANVLVTDDGNVKLGDFGIARFATQVSGSGHMMGTPAYLSPEQIRGEPQNTRSDLFSLGIVLYQMVTGVAPFEGSSVSAVCAQILSAEPIPPTQRNPALPAGIDHVILRSLAKSPAGRYPSAESLAASLYPFARLAPGAAEPQPRPPVSSKRSWLTRPMQPSELWVAVAVALVAVCSVPVSRAVAARYRLPAAPVVAKHAPAPPQDLLGYSRTTTVPDVEADVRKASTKVAHKPRTRHADEGVLQSAAIRAVVPAAKDANESSSPSAPELTSLPIPSPVSRADHATMKIEIHSTVGDGALAIFADQTLLFTTELHATAATAPIRLDHALPVGPHQLRVCLYRADKSLQVAKEGLGEIHTEGQNTLHIHVMKRAKLLVRHETSLDVSWPSAVTPAAAPAGGASAKLSASTK